MLSRLLAQAFIFFMPKPASINLLHCPLYLFLPIFFLFVRHQRRVAFVVTDYVVPLLDIGKSGWLKCARDQSIRSIHVLCLVHVCVCVYCIHFVVYIVSSANQLAITPRTSTVHSLLRHIVYVVLDGRPVYREDAVPNGRINLCVRFNFE